MSHEPWLSFRASFLPAVFAGLLAVVATPTIAADEGDAVAKPAFVAGDRAWTAADVGEDFRRVWTFRVAELGRRPIHVGFRIAGPGAGRAAAAEMSLVLADNESRTWGVVTGHFRLPGATPFVVTPDRPAAGASAAAEEPREPAPLANEFIGTVGPGHVQEHEISLFVRRTAAGWRIKVGDEAGSESTEIAIPFAMLPADVSLTPFVRVPGEVGDGQVPAPCPVVIDDPAPVKAPEKGVFGTLVYQFFKPAVRDGEKYPLVVCLHGARGVGTDNRGRGIQAYAVLRSSEVQAKHPCFLLVPQKPAAPPLWVGAHFFKGSYDLDETPETPHVKNVHDLILKLVAEHPIDPDRISITGQSMGGFGTWDMSLRYPDLFAAAIPICGGGSPKHAARLKNMAVWAFHGDQDTTVPVSGSREMVKALEVAGATKAKYTEFPGAGHVIMDEVWATPGIVDWLFAQRRGSSD